MLANIKLWRLVVYIASVMVAFLPGAIFAQEEIAKEFQLAIDTSGKACMSQEGRAKYINELSLYFKYIEAQIVKIPAEITSNISKERRESFVTGDMGRLRAIRSNLFFKPYLLNEKGRELNGTLEKLLKLNSISQKDGNYPYEELVMLLITFNNQYYIYRELATEYATDENGLIYREKAFKFIKEVDSFQAGLESFIQCLMRGFIKAALK